MVKVVAEVVGGVEEVALEVEEVEAIVEVRFDKLYMEQVIFLICSAVTIVMVNICSN